MLGSSMARSRVAGGGSGGGARRGGGAGRAEVGRALAEVPLCRVLDGDHLQGRWVQNCDPQTITRPDRYAYGHTLPGSPGNWDYRQCFKMSYEERERSRAALSWSWQPAGCRLRKVEGATFSAWLGQRTLLLWGDSLTGQQFYSLVFMLGDAVTSLLDYSHDAAHERQAESRRDGACGASGFGVGLANETPDPNPNPNPSQLRVARAASAARAVR